VFEACYVLMTCKRLALYAAVLHEVHGLVPEFQPDAVMADFEVAPVHAITVMFGIENRSSFENAMQLD
jgi:hypothetical protein